MMQTAWLSQKSGSKDFGAPGGGVSWLGKTWSAQRLIQFTMMVLRFLPIGGSNRYQVGAPISLTSAPFWLELRCMLVCLASYGAVVGAAAGSRTALILPGLSILERVRIRPRSCLVEYGSWSPVAVRVNLALGRQHEDPSLERDDPERAFRSIRLTLVGRQSPVSPPRARCTRS